MLCRSLCGRYASSIQKMWGRSLAFSISSPHNQIAHEPVQHRSRSALRLERALSGARSGIRKSEAAHTTWPRNHLGLEHTSRTCQQAEADMMVLGVVPRGQDVGMGGASWIESRRVGNVGPASRRIRATEYRVYRLHETSHAT